MAGSLKRLKLLYLIDILRKHTDEEHPLSAPEICEKLAEYGISAERKAIYEDLEALTVYGFDIIKTRVPKSGYFLASREFETSEVYLLEDAVRTARFISAKKTRELISKLDGMLSIHQSRRLLDGIYVSFSGKCKNEEIFYNIDHIKSAIDNKHKISFKYTSKELGEGKAIKLKEKRHKISPYALTWQDDHYYLIGNNEKYGNLMHLRIDRMSGVEEINEPVRPYSEVCDYRDYFDVADYTRRLFSMYGGETEKVELRCSREILEQVTDRFGDDIFITNLTDTHFNFSCELSVSPALVTWILNYGNKIEVVSPQNLRDKVIARAEEALRLYGKY